MAEPDDPAPMSPAAKIAYAIILPLAAIALVFLPAGRLDWRPGWIFLGVMTLAFTASALVLARLNPRIFRARSRFQPGTEKWDLILVALMLPVMAAVIPVAAFDAGRAHWSHVPIAVVVAGYVMIIVGIAGTAWAQTVNPFFEPGVRLQTERGQHVIDTGPYRIVRHPGYSSALLLFVGMALALASWWALVPAALSAALLVLRTAREDRLLQAKLPGYADFAKRTRSRLIPGLW
jgi:protein-S-isoprenylcysteine O-methyltransferase Ste14